MDHQIQQVLTLCPHISEKSIERDLRITGSVAGTINRIFDGIVPEVFLESSSGTKNNCSIEDTSGASTSKKTVDSGIGEQHSSDDDDDLPSIVLSPSSLSHLNTTVTPTGYVKVLGDGEELGGGEASIGESSGIPKSKSGSCDQSASNSSISRVCINTPTNLAKNDQVCYTEKVADCSHGGRSFAVETIKKDVIIVDEPDTLDLTGDSSDNDNEGPLGLGNPGIAVSRSDEEHAAVLCHHSETNSECSKLVLLDYERSPKGNGTAIADVPRGSAQITSADDAKQSTSVDPTNAKSSGVKMIDISSSDESDDELPLWKRVQLNRGQSPTKCHSGSGRTLTEIVPNQDNLHDHVRNKEVSSSVKLPKSTGSQESKSSKISLEYVSSSIDDPLDGMSSGVPTKTSTSTDLSQASTKGVKRKKRSPEEIQRQREQALVKKLERDKKKEELARLRDGKKNEKQREADHRKALREAYKAIRPEECMKGTVWESQAAFVRLCWTWGTMSMTVSVDQSLLEGRCGSQILQKLQELTCKVSVDQQPIEGAITWSRLSAEQNLGQDIQLDSLQKTIQETESLVIINIEDFVPLVHASLQSRLGITVESETLIEHASQSIATLGGKVVTYIVLGAQQYFRNSKNRHQRNFRSAVLGEDPVGNAKKKGKRKKKAGSDDLPNVTRVQMEEVLVDLQLQHSCNVHFRETPESVAEVIAMFTKAVAEKPFKKQRDKGTFSFHVNSEWAGGAKVSKDGGGLIKVWRQQLQQFKNVSPEIASAIISQYPSPQLLLKGYERCSSTKEAEMLLQDIVIRRGEGVLATSRRVGPELSRRVYKQMTSTDETMVL